MVFLMRRNIKSTKFFVPSECIYRYQSKRKGSKRERFSEVSFAPRVALNKAQVVIMLCFPIIHWLSWFLNLDLHRWQKDVDCSSGPCSK